MAGLTKKSSDWASGKTASYTGITAGGWFGEGSMLKTEPRRYDVIALRDTRVACMKRETFHWLLDHSIAFNRFVINQINERLGLFIGLLGSERLAGVDARGARAIGAGPLPAMRVRRAPGTAAAMALDACGGVMRSWPPATTSTGMVATIPWLPEPELLIAGSVAPPMRASEEAADRMTTAERRRVQ